MKTLQGSPAISQVIPQQGGAPAFPQQYPAPYSAVQLQDSTGGMTEMISAIMPIFILMMLMMMMKPMMQGMTD